MTKISRTVTVTPRKVVNANVRMSRAMQDWLHLPTDKTLWVLFDREADALLRTLPDGSVVLDLGGGRRFIYGKSVAPKGRLRVIAVDISAEELAMNTDVTETCVADVATELPFAPGTADLILSRALLEHVRGVPSAIEQMAQVLKPGGVALHMVPCRFSLFGTAARMLPFGPLLRLLHFVRPESRGNVEFPVVYDHCWPQALERAFRAAGFRDVRCEITWACPGYFEAAFPLFIFQAVWEWTMRKLRVRALAAYTVIYATR